MSAKLDDTTALDQIMVDYAIDVTNQPLPARLYTGVATKQRIKDLVLDLIAASRVSEKLPNGEDFSYLNEQILRQKVAEL